VTYCGSSANPLDGAVCSANSLSLKYLRSPAVRLDNKCLFSCVCSEFDFMTFWLQPQCTSSSKWGSRISCHPKLDLLSSWTWFRAEWKHPHTATLLHTTGSQIKFGMTGYARASLGRGCACKSRGYVWTMPICPSNRFADEPVLLTWVRYKIKCL